MIFANPGWVLLPNIGVKYLTNSLCTFLLKSQVVIITLRRMELINQF